MKGDFQKVGSRLFYFSLFAQIYAKKKLSFALLIEPLTGPAAVLGKANQHLRPFQRFNAIGRELALATSSCSCIYFNNSYFKTRKLNLMSATFSNNPQQRILTIGGVAIAILLLLVAVLLYNKYGQDKEIEAKNVELEQATEVHEELQKEYDDAIAQLDEALAENTGLKGEIDKQKEALAAQKAKIDKMIKSGSSSKAELNKARDEIKDLIRKQTEFLARIDQLERDNQQLTNQNQSLSSEKVDLQGQVAEKDQTLGKLKDEKQALEQNKQQLEEKQQQLETTKAQLSEKVDVASVIKATNIEAGGYKMKESGKRVSKRYAKNVDVVSVCFKANENEIVDGGTEAFYVRIVSPLGETLAQEGKGSGTLVHAKTGESFRYTTIAETDYNNQAVDVCADWNPGQTFVKGEYLVEIYNKGYLAGSTHFTLK